MFQKILQGGGGSGNVKDIKWILKDGELESGYSLKQLSNNLVQITKRNGYYEFYFHPYGSGVGIDIINSGYKYVFVDVLLATKGVECFFNVTGYYKENIILTFEKRLIIGYDISNLNNITPNISGGSSTAYLYNLWLEK